MTKRANTTVSLFLCTGCVQVSWYPIYEDVVPARGEGAAVSENGATATVQYERHLMRDYPTSGDETRSQIASPWLRVALFPVNLVANMLSNAAAGLVRPFSRSCCVALPGDFLEGLFHFGPRDAWHGYPFWEPTELDPRSVDSGYDL
jgi:hypothetical protein